MKLPYPVLFTMALTIAASAPLICPDEHVSNCYPQIFEPTDKFQVVKEGQHIPPGLHVRLNMDTGQQEAKLLSDEDSGNNEVIVVEQEEDSTEEAEVSKEQLHEQSIEDKIRKYVQEDKSSFRKSHVNEAELSDFESSVKEIANFGTGGDVSRLNKALDTLIELSHDIEYGASLTNKGDIFRAMSKVADVAGNVPGIAEKVYRIMGSSLRNNPEAVSNFLDNQAPEFVTDLYNRLQSGELSEVLQKRVLGVIHALTADKFYAYSHFNTASVNSADGLTKLIQVFPSLGESAQERILLILEDLKIVDNSDDNAGHRMSEYLQGLLHQSLCKSEEQLQNVMTSLVDLHKKEKLPVGGDFLQWLSKEVEERRTGTKKRDSLYSNTNPDFDQLLYAVRHTVFGNDKARKMDEL